MRPDSRGFSGDAAKSENSNNSDSVKRVMRSQGEAFCIVGRIAKLESSQCADVKQPNKVT